MTKAGSTRARARAHRGDAAADRRARARLPRPVGQVGCRRVAVARRLRRRAAGVLDFSHTLSTAPGTDARSSSRRSLREDTRLRRLLRPPRRGRARHAGARHELASGSHNLETLLRERKALVGEFLQLSVPAADGATEAVLGTVRVDLDALPRSIA